MSNSNDDDKKKSDDPYLTDVLQFGVDVVSRYPSDGMPQNRWRPLDRRLPGDSENPYRQLVLERDDWKTLSADAFKKLLRARLYLRFSKFPRRQGRRVDIAAAEAYFTSAVFKLYPHIQWVPPVVVPKPTPPRPMSERTVEVISDSDDDKAEAKPQSKKRAASSVQRAEESPAKKQKEEKEEVVVSPAVAEAEAEKPENKEEEEEEEPAAEAANDDGNPFDWPSTPPPVASAAAVAAQPDPSPAAADAQDDGELVGIEAIAAAVSQEVGQPKPMDVKPMEVEPQRPHASPLRPHASPDATMLNEGDANDDALSDVTSVGSRNEDVVDEKEEARRALADTVVGIVPMKNEQPSVAVAPSTPSRSPRRRGGKSGDPFADTRVEPRITRSHVKVLRDGTRVHPDGYGLS
jgi:hypothetical protein